MSKRFFSTLMLGLAVTCFSAIPASVSAQETREAVQETTEQETAQDEKTMALAKQLQGKWLFESMKMGGRGDAPAEVLAEFSFTFVEDVLKVRGMAAGEVDCEMKLDGTASPATLSFKPKDETEWAKGIIKVNEDGTATICFGRPGSDDLPTKFELEDAPGRMLASLKRADEKADDDE